MEDASCSSESTNEVFFEMLGLPVMDVGAISSAIINDDENNSSSKPPQQIISGSSISIPEDKQPRVSFLDVPNKCSRYLHQPSTVAAYVIDSLIAPSECRTLIHLAEELSSAGFHYVTEASHTDSEGITHKVKLREPNKHKLSVFEHTATLHRLWSTIEPVISPHINQFIEDTQCGPPLGLNPRLRVLRYDATDNDVFDPHFDATTKVMAKEYNREMTSLLTVLIYLNDGGGKDFDGGETFYLDSTNPNVEATKVVPSTGSAVIFEHDLFHSSVPLKFGTKYVLRTDIMFQLDEGAGVNMPRGKNSDNPQSVALTLLELCEELSIDEEAKTCLSNIGLIDLTLESLVAPGMTALKQMLLDVLDEDVATLLLTALVSGASQN